MRLTKTKPALRAVAAALVSVAAIGMGVAAPAEAASNWKAIERNHQPAMPKDKGGRDAEVIVLYKGKKVGHAWFDAKGEHFTARLHGNATKVGFRFQYSKGGKWRTAMKGFVRPGDTSLATWGWDVGPHWWHHDNGYNLKEGRPTRIEICPHVGSSHTCAFAHGVA